MDFVHFDKMMRVYEESLDQKIIPGVYMIVRLDGRCFHQLTDKYFKKPFDEVFAEFMKATTIHLMEESGFKCTYGYIQSDEISLLIDFNSELFNRKVRKFDSILAGEASAKFSMLMKSLFENFNETAVFDARVIPIPNEETLWDYFLWRQEDCHRNALNSWCYHTLLAKGASKKEANDALLKRSLSDKNELLFQNGINYNDVPNWQKRGIGLYYKTKNFYKEKDNKSKGKVMYMRDILKVDLNLPYDRANYIRFLTDLVLFN